MLTKNKARHAQRSFEWPSSPPCHASKRKKKMYSLRSSTHKRNQGANPAPVPQVLVPKKLHQLVLLDADATAEEPPQDKSVGQKAEGVAEDELRAEAPVEEAKVAGVSDEGVDAGGDEGVGGCFPGLDGVVEAGSGVEHGGGADDLAGEDHGEAEEEGEKVEGCGGGGEEGVPDEAFETAHCVGDGVGGPVGREEEGGDGGLGGVSRGRGPVLEEVEEGEGGDEEGDAPEGRAGEEEGEEGGQEGGGEDGAEDEGAEGYAGEGHGLVGIDGLEALGGAGGDVLLGGGDGVSVVKVEW